MFDGDLLWPFSALPPRFHLHAYVTVSEERRLVWPNDWESIPGVVCLQTQKHHLGLFISFFFSFFMFRDAPGRRGKDREGQGRKQWSGRVTVRQTTGLRIRRCMLGYVSVSQSRRERRKQGIIVNTSNQH